MLVFTATCNMFNYAIHKKSIFNSKQLHLEQTVNTFNIWATAFVNIFGLHLVLFLNDQHFLKICCISCCK